MAWTKESRVKALISKRLKGCTNQYTKAKSEGKVLPVSPNKGCVGHFKGKTHSNITKMKQKQKALASNHRRLRRKMIEYVSSNGQTILLDSNWELELARHLDALNINWIRPQPIAWVDKNGIVHNYFPDFYLTDYNLYLDPKNPHAYNVQKEKIDILNKTYNNIIWLTDLEQIRNYKPL